MTSLFDAIHDEIGAGGFASIGQQIGATPDQTKSAIGAALPALIGGLAKNANGSNEGAMSLANALDRDHMPSLAERLGGGGGGGGDALMGALGGLLGGGGGGGGGGLMGAVLGAAMGGSQNKGLDGAGILGHVLGSRQEPVQQGVSKASGLNMETVAKLLPILAPIVMSALANMKRDKNLDAGGVAGYLEDEQQQIASKAGRSGGLASMLDLDNDGSMMDELGSIGGALISSGALSKLF